MNEKIIQENGQIKIEQTQETPAPVKTGLAQALRALTRRLDDTEALFNANQQQLDRICSQLTVEHWQTLAITQIQMIAIRNKDAADYLATII